MAGLNHWDGIDSRALFVKAGHRIPCRDSMMPLLKSLWGPCPLMLAYQKTIDRSSHAHFGMYHVVGGSRIRQLILEVYPIAKHLARPAVEFSIWFRVQRLAMPRNLHGEGEQLQVWLNPAPNTWTSKIHEIMAFSPTSYVGRYFLLLLMTFIPKAKDIWAILF